MSSRPNRKVKPSAVKSRSRNKKLAVVGVIAVIAIIIVAFVLLNQNNAGNPDNSPSPSATASPSPSATSSPTTSASPSATPTPSSVGEYSANGTRVLLQTSLGNITLQLRDDKPITTTNFINLVQQGFYDETIFHRVMQGFMIQGGYNQTTASNIADEIGSNNHNYNGTIAMGNTGAANSASSQFFINVANNNNLFSSFDALYTVFGKVIDGMDVVMAISHVSVQNNGYGEISWPVETVTLISATVLS